jgi:PAS domain S-box-containing protein
VATALPQSPEGACPGDIIGQYIIRRKLGSGGGAVYLAHDIRLDRRASLKLLSPHFQADQTAWVRLLREARAASALSHPAICVVYDIGEDRGRAYYVAMEHVEGQLLATGREERFLMSPLRIRSWLKRHRHTSLLGEEISITLRDVGGDIVGVIGVVRGITERKRAQRELRVSKDRHRDLAEHSEDLICTHDLDGRLLFVNEAAARTLRYSQSQLLRRTIRDILAPEVREDFGKYISVIKRDGVTKGLMLVLTSTGERRIWEYHNMLQTEGVAAPVVHGTAHDITERKQAEMTIRSLLRISEKLNSTLDVDELLNSLVIEAMKLTDAEIGWSGLRTAEGMVCHNYCQSSQMIPFEYYWPPGIGWPGGVLVHKEPYLTNDAQADSVIVPEIRERFGVKSGIGTPILDRHGEVIGFFEVINRKGDSGFTEADMEKLIAVSQAASVALQNALGYRKLKQAQESLRQLAGRLLRLQDEERRRLARELHDGTAQTLATLKVNLAVIEKSAAMLEPRARHALAESLVLAEQCLREVRTVSYLLHPPALDELGLQSALNWYVHGFVERSGIRVDLDLPTSFGRLSRDLEMTLFRIVQESLVNIHRHSGSRTARIRILRSSDEVKMEVSDKGRGMPGGKARDRNLRLGVGIPGMQERVRQLGGRLEIVSGNHGTTVKVFLPLS